MAQTRKIAFIGAGNMPQSIIGGMVQGGYPADAIYASNPSQPSLDILKEKHGIHTSNDNIEVAKAADVIVLSVKPQIMADACAYLRENLPDLNQKLVVTIAAGIRIEKYHQYLGNDVSIIRVMPNTPSLVGEGFSGVVADNNASADDKNFVLEVFNYVGKTISITDEDDIDVVGAVSGSGPAYFFEFMASLQKAAEAHGLSSEDARAMVQQTALGAAAMAGKSELTLEELRKQVTSKGGSTAKGVEVYQEANIDQISERAVNAAVARNQEMAKLF
ncbi:pyrroline-5-carboxylate reductase [Aliidiomarina minuta]|uniref:Pyrroline-5-carboxylate reductase n=1 Tax=Aliidiomarina minuta TaxID=880057 RepID=A0A432W1B2_9GAMM|nr:pyrroline-5-carboxylate reductase [Aliidiomarina minuta]RUO22963.1 pyrroline-5-carboxylate reductase [Aliidiomarina minuta]